MNDALPDSPLVRNILRAARDAVAFGVTEGAAGEQMVQAAATWVGASMESIPMEHRANFACEIIGHFSNELLRSAGVTTDDAFRAYHHAKGIMDAQGGQHA